MLKVLGIHAAVHQASMPHVHMDNICTHTSQVTAQLRLGGRRRPQPITPSLTSGSLAWVLAD
jgi:hypothetical protein